MPSKPKPQPPPRSPSPDEWVDWIDEQGRTLQALPRADIRRRNLLHRVTATFVFHPDGRVFVQRRADSKDVYPGLYDMAVGGTVASGEDFATNARREIAEELGARNVPLYRLFSHRFRDAHTHSWIEVFACEYDGPITLQPEEVAEGYWADQATVQRLIDARRMCPDSAQAWCLYGDQCRAEGELRARIEAGRLQPVAVGA